MNKIQNTIAVSLLAGLYLLAGCASPVSRIETTDSKQPDEIVQSVFVDRVKDVKSFATGGTWHLDELQPHFAADLRARISDYLNQLESFSRHYGKYDLSITRLNDYFMMSRFDPVTSCDRPPLHTRVRKIQSSEMTCKFQVTYRLWGNRSPYDKSIIVSMALNQEQWLITEVQYQKATFPLLNEQTLSAVLVFWSKELRASSAWAVQHRDELVPNGKIQPTGRGPFDRP